MRSTGSSSGHSQTTLLYNSDRAIRSMTPSNVVPIRPKTSADRAQAPQLEALTGEARAALQGPSLALTERPFRIGRESRVANRPVAVERRRGDAPKTNDLYVRDTDEYWNVSREHLLIDRDAEGYYVLDRGSACGTIVGGRAIGGERRGGRTSLHDNDVIVVGTASSPFVFRFRVGNGQ